MRRRSGRPCEWCGYVHDAEEERASARSWHEAHDAGAGLRFELETLKGGTHDIVCETEA